MARTPFKLKSSPAKGSLSNFFQGMGDKLREGHTRRKVTDTEYKKERTAGESKYQFDVRTKKPKAGSEVAKVGKTGHKGGDVLTKNIIDVTDLSTDNLRKLFPPKPPHTVEDTPKSKAYVPQEFKGEAGDKFRYRKTGETEDVAGIYTGGFNEYEFMDPNRPGKWIPAQGVDGDYTGFNAIHAQYLKAAKKRDGLFDSPIEKKSPYKKGLGKYAKQAKGSRGYKMKK